MLRDETQPELVIELEQFIGGLGNQCFQVAALSALAVRYPQANVIFPLHQMVAPGAVSSPCYTTTLFHRASRYQQSVTPITYPPSDVTTIHLRLGQFEDVQLALEKILTDQKALPLHIKLDCMCMNLASFHRYREVVKHMLTMPTWLSESIPERKSLPHDTAMTLAIGIRRYAEEGRIDWALTAAYYKKAITAMVQKIGCLSSGDNVLLVGDVGAKDIEADIMSILSSLNCNPQIHWLIGKRDGTTDVAHFEYMSCNVKHFILSTSTFHFWPAYMSYTPTSVVCYPARYSSWGIWPPEWLPIE